MNPDKFEQNRLIRSLMGSLLVALLGLAGSVAPLHAGSPLYTFNDWADLYFDGDATIAWDSNIFRDEEDEQDDITYIVSPGLELNLGRGLSAYDMTVRTSYDFIRYQENDHLDADNFHVNTTGVYRGSRLDLSGLLGYDENQITSGEANMNRSMIETEDVRGKIDGEYRLSPKFSLGAGAHYLDRSYSTTSMRGRDSLADRNHLRFPFDLFYEFTPKVDLSAGYTYKTGEVDSYINTSDTRIGGYDSTEHFLNVGSRGNFFPKLSGFFKVGYRTRDTDDSVNILADGTRRPVDRSGGSDGHVGLDSGFTWNATQKSTHNIVLERDFGVGGQGSVTEVSRIRVNSGYNLNPRWSASSKLGYTLRDYQDDSNREDKQYLLGLGLNYTAPDYWRFSGGYRYLENDSSQRGFSYNSHNFYLTAQLRY